MSEEKAKLLAEVRLIEEALADDMSDENIDRLAALLERLHNLEAAE